MQISVASSNLVSVPLIEALASSKHELSSIITNPDAKTGRGQSLIANPLAQWAEARGFNVAKPADTIEINRHLLAAQPQIVITAAYGKLIPAELLRSPRFGWLNLHFSLLPRWRGAAPVQWAILSGDRSTGISIFRLEKGMDTGPLFYSEEIEIRAEDKTSDLLTRLSQLGGRAILPVLDRIAAGEKPVPQSANGVTYAPKITKDMGRIDWTSPSEQILRVDRALGERPGIWTTFRGERVALHDLKIAKGSASGEHAGSISPGEERAICVQAGDGAIEVAEVTPAGKKRMSGAEFLRGVRLQPGDRFD